MLVILNKIKIFIFSLGVFFFAGCGCTTGPVSLKLTGFEVKKDKRNFATDGQLKIDFRFLSEMRKEKSPRCLTYNKELAVGIDSDIVLKDSVKVFCDKKLYFNIELEAKTILLYYKLTQNILMPESINTNLIGVYLLNLENVQKDSLLKNNPYNFKIQVQTNNKILTDTINITFK